MRNHRISLFLAVVLLSPLCFTHLAGQTNELTLADIFNSGKYATKTLSGVHWMRDGKHYSYTERDTSSKTTNILVYGVNDRSKNVVVDAAKLKLNPEDPPFRFTSYLWSPDEHQILFISAPPEREYLSRLTPAGNIFLYDLTTRSFTRLTNVQDPQYNVKFSPDGKYVGFVRANNIYLIDLSSGNEEAVTTDGADHIINGKFDWVYEEEFEIADGWRWSPDSKHIAFWHLDENRVPGYTITEWDSLHLQLIHMRYPKSGDPNSIVKIGVADIRTKATRWIDLGANDDLYIPRIQWTLDPSTLAIQRLNRAQDSLQLLYADISTGSCRLILTETDDKWVDVTNDLTFLKDGNFIWPSERDGYRHLYLYRNDGTLVNQITKGEWEVETFYGVDEKSSTVYYSSTEQSPLERQIYKIRLDGKHRERLSAGAGTHAANFSPTMEFYLDTFSDVTTPPELSLVRADGAVLTVLERSNADLYKGARMGTTRFLKLKTSDGAVLNASIMTPADFDSTKRYPVLVYTYGGPGSQVVLNSWGRSSDALWYAYLSHKGYLVFMVDNRGTGGRGSAFKKIGYKKLGMWEVNDHIEAAKYLSSLPYVDKNRIGIWGWSYGGYTSCMVILNAADYFKLAIAVAPVTDWRFYDDIYTERYMGTPKENPEGYKSSSALTSAAKLKGKFLIIHGTSDDNVHFQNTADMVSALERANKQFSTMFYPDKNHGIYGGLTRFHLYTLMTDFILANL